MLVNQTYQLTLLSSVDLDVADVRECYTNTVYRWGLLIDKSNFLLKQPIVQGWRLCLSVCLFGGFRPLENGDFTITDEGLQILTYTRHSCPWSSECSLACHMYCDTGHLWDLVTLTPVADPVTTCFNNFVLSLMEFEHPTFRMQDQNCNRQLYRRGLSKFNMQKVGCSIPTSTVQRFATGVNVMGLRRWP